MSTRPEVFERVIETSSGEVVRIYEPTREDAAIAIDYLELIGGESDFLTFGLGEFGRDVAYEEEFFESKRQSETDIALIARSSRGDVVGMLSFGTGARARMRHSGEFGVSVFKRCQGEGIASAMLSMLIDWVSRNDVVRKVNLFVREDNHGAIALYLKFGFVIEGRIEKAMCVDGIYYDDYAMGLWIDRG